MNPIHVWVSSCAKTVNGADKEVLFQIWNATKDINRPYRIVEAMKTGDADHYIIMDAA